MKNIKIFLLITLMLFSVQLAAATAEVETYPIFAGVNPADTQNSIDQIIADVNENGLVSKLGNQSNLALGFGKSTAYLPSTSRLLTAANFETFFVATGISAAIEGDVAKIADIDENSPDPSLGASFGFLFFGGFNGDKINGIPVKGLVFTAKFGYSNNKIGEITQGSMLLGAGVDYKLYTPKINSSKSFQPGPVYLGSGVTYASNTIKLSIEQEYNNTDDYAYYVLDQNADIEMKSTAIIIPLDIHSSVNVLWALNFFAGIGCDVVLGSTTIDVETDSDIKAYRDSSGGQQLEKTQQESIVLKNSKTEENTPVFIFHTTVGFGLKLGAVHVDVPFSFYPASGMSGGIIASVAL